MRSIWVWREKVLGLWENVIVRCTQSGSPLADHTVLECPIELGLDRSMLTRPEKWKLVLLSLRTQQASSPYL